MQLLLKIEMCSFAKGHKKIHLRSGGQLSRNYRDLVKRESFENLVARSCGKNHLGNNRQYQSFKIPFSAERNRRLRTKVAIGLDTSCAAAAKMIN